jgi:hypothetical protein
MQLFHYPVGRGNIFFLGEAYAFGVMWSFALKGLFILVLRHSNPAHAIQSRLTEDRLIGSVGLAIITAILFALCVINLLQEVATMSGAFTLIFFAIFTISERTTRKHASAHAELDQFNLEPGDDLTPEALGVRPGSVLVPARNYNTLYNLKAVLDRVDTHAQDVVVLHLRFLQRAGGGGIRLAPDQLFSLEAQALHACARDLQRKGRPSIWRSRRPQTDGTPC